MRQNARKEDDGTIEGVVFDIQRCALDDGPGIRTTVFLKGCPLRCAWCHNPESQEKAIQQGKSGKIYGWRTSVSEVMDGVLRDRSYFEGSGGGLTVSGGEPTFQPKFCEALLRSAKAEGIHTCLDTCGFVDGDVLRRVIEYVDLILFDIKHDTSTAHLRWTGVGLEKILENLHRISSFGKEIRLRCPLIPGVNDNEAFQIFVRQLAQRYAIHEYRGVEFLPYHDIGRSKYADLEMDAPVFQSVRE